VNASTDNPVTFRGGIAAGLIRASWPFGLLIIRTDGLRVAASMGLRATDVKRENVDEIVFRRTPIGGCRLDLVQIGGERTETAFMPTNPGRVATALEERGSPVHVELARPRTSPVVFTVLGIALMVLALGELVVRSGHADTIKARSVVAESRIDSIERSGGKRYGTVRYSVDSETFEAILVLFSSQELGDKVVIEYDPAKPSLAWKQGDDPPGTTEWIFGPLGVVPGLLLLFLARRHRELRRYFDARPAP
jgi:hypothetical protein